MGDSIYKWNEYFGNDDLIPKEILVTNGKNVCLHKKTLEENISGEYMQQITCPRYEHCEIFHWEITHWMELPKPKK